MLLELIPMTVRMSAPLALAALGGVYSERSGVVNIGLEGMMLMGAFGYVIGTHASASPWIGLDYWYHLRWRDGAAPRTRIHHISGRPDCQWGFHQPPSNRHHGVSRTYRNLPAGRGFESLGFAADRIVLLSSYT